MIEADLAQDDGWQAAVADADVVVFAHAQIGGLDEAAFTANNVTATERVLEAVRAKSPYVVHLSSSVVNPPRTTGTPRARTRRKSSSPRSGLPAVVLRPTLMFGWFDRKHLGWLARFMQKAPVFPIPGSGRYLRQPLYAGDFCDIIMACIEQRPVGKAYNISGQEQIDYIDLIRAVKEATRRAGADRAHPLFAVLARCSRSTRCSTATRRSPPSSSRRWSRRTCSR